MQIDELIVKLVLDKSGFQQGQQQARDEITKTKDAGQQAAKESEKAQIAAETAQKKTSEAAIKRQKDVEEHSKRLGETLGKVTGTATALFTALSGGQAIGSFLSGVNASNAATSRLSTNLGVSGDKVVEWQKRIIAAGGSAEDANSALGGIADAFQKLSTGQQVGNGGFWQRMGLNAKDLENSSSALEKIGSRLREIQKTQGRQAALGIAGASGFLTQADTNYLLSNDAQRAEIDAKAKANKPLASDLSTAEHHSKAMAELGNAMDALGTRINAKLLPTFDHLIDGISSWISRISTPGHEGELAATVAGGAVAAAAGLALAKKTVQGIITKAVSAAMPSVEAAAPKAAPSLLGRLGSLLGFGAKIAGGVAIGTAIDAVQNTTNDGEAEVLAKMRANGQIPQRGPIYTGSEPEGPIHKSSFTAGESLNQRVDNFWSTFGNGLIEWLDRQGGHSQTNGSGRDPNISNASYSVPNGGGSAFSSPSRSSGSGGVSGMGSGAPAIFGGPAASGSAAGPGGLFGNLEGKYGLPGGLLDNIWSAESARGRNMRNSSAGAQGHFQFMPGTARAYGVTNPYDLGNSATGAAKYFSNLLKMFRGDYRKAIAGYNWGEGHIKQNERLYGADWDKHLPAETRNYLNKVTRGMDPQNRYANSGAASHSSKTEIGDVHIHTNAKDARGISQEIQAELQQRQLVARANTGLV